MWTAMLTFLFCTLNKHGLLRHLQQNLLCLGNEMTCLTQKQDSMEHYIPMVCNVSAALEPSSIACCDEASLLTVHSLHLSTKRVSSGCLLALQACICSISIWGPFPNGVRE